MTYISPLGVVDERWLQTHAQVEKLTARIFDADLTALAEEFLDASIPPITTLDTDRALEDMTAVTNLARKINARVGALLPDLFQATH